MWEWLPPFINLVRPVLQVLTRNQVANLAAEMGNCHKDKDLLGSEIWRNHTELVWFVKCTRCPGAGALRPSRNFAEQWALSHWQSTHRGQ